jgi:DNA-directed RNA polymerase subunit RPC12/RpoP
MTGGLDHGLLQVLALVPKDAHLAPSWEPRARLGVMYGGLRAGLDEDRVAEDLEALADLGYLERIFVERLMTCPTCESHAVNVHEACVTCGSSNLKRIVTYFHYRCGFIGPESAFKKESGGLRCPKCKKFLVDLGTDHDSPGVMFECLNCAAKFQNPEIGVRCLSCGASFTGAEVEEVHHRDVFAYRLTTQGDAALAEGAVRGRPNE